VAESLESSIYVGTRVGPYEVRELIGRGGMGRVYRAHDPRLGRELALKLLAQQDDEDTLAVHRFVREARAASALNHPNVVTIYEIGEDTLGRYIAMELVDGITLRALGDGTLPSDQVVRIGAQVARALAAAHAAGIVHRDIKPENILLRRDGFVKVLDFGIARLVGDPDARETRDGLMLTEIGTSVGTLRYMSPEQACAEPVTGATDVFSLGLILHELATGRHPFVAPGSSNVAILGAILSTPAPPLSTSNAALPAGLGALVARMLEKEPAHRPTAVEVERALQELMAEASVTPTIVPSNRASLAGRQHTVGRESEWRMLQEVLRDAEAGRGMLISVSGEPGIGKSTLVEALLSDLTAATRPWLVARGRCSERLAGTEAYLPILEALESLTRGAGAAQVVPLMKRVAPSWYLQVAPAGVEDSSEGRVLASAQASSQERIKRELAAFLEALSASTPVVLFLDDLHWADPSTVDMLAYLGARIATLRLLLLVTVRPAELLLAKHPFAQLKLDLQSRGSCRELILGFLGREAVEQYLSLEFPGHGFPATFARLIHEKTEGSPLFMADLLRYLRARGVIALDAGRWTLAQSIPAIEHELPESTRGMIQRKIEQLGDDDRRLLAAASVQGYAFDSTIVAGLVSISAANVEERLESLEHVHDFVRRAREHELPDGAINVRYRFVHVLYQNALYAGLTPTRRVSLSAHAARLLLAHHRERSAEIATELAALFEAARDPRSAVEHLIVAAQNAARVFAAQEAATLSRRALELLAQLPDTPERAERELLLQSTRANAIGATYGLTHPDVRIAAANAYELWKQLGARPDRFPVLAGMWAYDIVAGHLDVAVAIGEELLQMAEETGARPMLVAAHNALALSLHHLGDHRRALVHFDRGLESYGRDLSPHFMTVLIEPGVSLLAESARVLWVTGYPDRALRRANEAIALADEVPHPEARGFAPLFAGFVHQLLGDVAGTLRHSESVLALSRERDIVTTMAWGMVLHGWALAMEGRVDEGLAEIRASLAGQLAAGALIARPQFLAILAEACLHAGRLDECLSATQDGLACSASTSDHYWDSELERLRGEALDRLGADAAEIEASFQWAIAEARTRGAKSLELRAATSAAQFRRAHGRHAAAHADLTSIYGWFTEGFDTADLLAARTLLESIG
jgi:predicted ATPase